MLQVSEFLDAVVDINGEWAMYDVEPMGAVDEISYRRSGFDAINGFELLKAITQAKHKVGRLNEAIASMEEVAQGIMMEQGCDTCILTLKRPGVRDPDCHDCEGYDSGHPDYTDNEPHDNDDLG